MFQEINLQEDYAYQEKDNIREGLKLKQQKKK
jgi:hypothetical protein